MSNDTEAEIVRNHAFTRGWELWQVITDTDCNDVFVDGSSRIRVTYDDTHHVLGARMWLTGWGRHVMAPDVEDKMEYVVDWLCENSY